MDEYVVSLPLWYLINTKQASPHDILGGTMDAGHQAAFLFSDEDLAERFVRSSPVFRTAAINDRAELEDFLNTLEQKGLYTHVGIDPSASAGRFVAIADLRRILAGPPNRRE